MVRAISKSISCIPLRTRLITAGQLCWLTIFIKLITGTGTTVYRCVITECKTKSRLSAGRMKDGLWHINSFDAG
jgi:hypothetical protein